MLIVVILSLTLTLTLNVFPSRVQYFCLIVSLSFILFSSSFASTKFITSEAVFFILQYQIYTLLGNTYMRLSPIYSAFIFVVCVCVCIMLLLFIARYSQFAHLSIFKIYSLQYILYWSCHVHSMKDRYAVLCHIQNFTFHLCICECVVCVYLFLFNFSFGVSLSLTI